MAGRKRHTETQIIAILKEVEVGLSIAEASRKHGVSAGTLHRWRSKYGGLESSQLKQLKDLEDENRRLKKLVADLSLDKQLLQEVLKRKW
ncbi:MAG: transposase [Dehalococcoidia bacterium]